ncbi:hypothetical protein QCA50_010241 [Cerrena zonata]|uniref:Uncharacterized protein n=1 Tax=Cerrena zonata TaxID=2478898 RepID=A0AAW0GAK5_9APHY
MDEAAENRGRIWQVLNRLLKRNIRIYGACVFALIGIMSNLLILVVYSLTFSFPRHSGFVNNIITLVGVWAKVLESITVLLTGWALSQKWSRTLDASGSTVGANFTGLQSLDIFASFGTLLQTTYSLVTERRHSTSIGTVSFVSCIVSAFILQLYPTAVTTLAVPILWNATKSSYFPPAGPFMSNHLSGTPCAAEEFQRQKHCLGDWNAVTAASNVLTLKQSLPSFSQRPNGYSESPFQSTPSSSWVLQTYNPVEQYQYRMVGQNYGLVGGVLDALYSDLIGVDPTGIFTQVPTSLPVLYCFCAPMDQASHQTRIVIAGVTYEVPIPIPILKIGTIAAQVTTNDMSLIMTYPSTSPSFNVHCALNLSITDPDNYSLTQISFWQPPEAFPNSSPRSIVFADAFLSKYDELRIQKPIKTFADVWLKSLGWGAQPSRNYVDAIVGTPLLFHDNASDPAVPFELYSMVMMIDAVNRGFPTFREVETEVPIPQLASAQYVITQYHIGARTATRLLSCGVLVLDILVLIWCLRIILVGEEWLPDWSDPVALACTAIASPSIPVCKQNSGGDLGKDVWQLQLGVRKSRSGGLEFYDKKYSNEPA